MGRTILGVLAGIVVAWLTITLCQFAGSALYPPPVGMDLRDPQQLAAFIEAAPAFAMALVVVGWGLGAFLGGWVAARIAHHPLPAALIIGALVLAGVIANNAMIPHRMWMTVIGVLVPLPAAWLGARCVKARAALTTNARSS